MRSSFIVWFIWIMREFKKEIRNQKKNMSTVEGNFNSTNIGCCYDTTYWESYLSCFGTLQSGSHNQDLNHYSWLAKRFKIAIMSCFSCWSITNLVFVNKYISLNINFLFPWAPFARYEPFKFYRGPRTAIGV